MCMRVFGGSIKVETDEFEKPARTYMLAVLSSPNNIPKLFIVQQKPTMALDRDMFRYGLIHLDMC